MAGSFIKGFVVGVALLVVAVVGASQLLQKDAFQEAEEKAYQTEILDASPVQSGIMTEQQRAHSSLYSDYRLRRGGKTISGLVAGAKGKSKFVGTGFSVGAGQVPQPDSPEHYFGQLISDSDAVILGKATKKVSQITADDSFIFTDYDVQIAEVLKGSPTASLSIGATITVTRAGGKVLIDGMIVRAFDDYCAPLPVNDHEIVLFLRFIPETGCYRSTQDTGSFELDGSLVRPLTGAAIPEGVLQDRHSFFKTIRALSK